MEDATTPHTVFQLRRRRGVVRASVTRLGHRLRELEETEYQAATPVRTCATIVHKLERSRL